MRIKSYFANSVTEAINRARAELGPDAMIIASNRTQEGSERLGAYEVVFGLADTTGRWTSRRLLHRLRPKAGTVARAHGRTPQIGLKETGASVRCARRACGFKSQRLIGTRRLRGIRSR